MDTLTPKRVVTKPWGRCESELVSGGFSIHASEGIVGHGERVGEVWFEPGGSEVLVKFLFTSDRLSIQVHPDDVQARVTHGKRGKDECWLVLQAEPGAQYGIGLTQEVSSDDLRSAASNGTLVSLLDWRAAHVGDFIYNPAGTVHALGPGLTVLEVQQNSDVTLRLFDYFSGRPLQVDEAVAVSRRGPHRHSLDTHLDFRETRILVDGPKFGFAYCVGQPPPLQENAKHLQLVTWKDQVTVGSTQVEPGNSMTLGDLAEIRARSDARYFLVWAVDRPAR